MEQLLWGHASIAAAVKEVIFLIKFLTDPETLQSAE
jgi:hypothetical protein